MTRKFLLGLVGAAFVTVASGNSAYAGGCAASRGAGQGGGVLQAPINQPIEQVRPAGPARVVVVPTNFTTSAGKPVAVKIVSTSVVKPEPIAKTPDPIFVKPIEIPPVDAIASVSDVLARR